VNAYAAIAAVLGYLGLLHTRATATVGGVHLILPALWLVVAALVLILAIGLLWLVRSIARDGGWRLVFWGPAGAA
jgi:hypothetical protein